MKRYQLGLFAVVFSVISFAFSTDSANRLVFFTYDLSGPQDLAANYDEASFSCSGDNQIICGIWAVEDGTTNKPTQASVNTAKTNAGVGNYVEATEKFTFEVSSVVEFKPE